MQAVRRSRLVSLSVAPVLAAVLAAAGLAAPALAAEARSAPEAKPAESFNLKVLSPADARAYANAFALVRQGEFEAAEAARFEDPLLAGRLLFAKLMHPDYRSSYEELSGWLDKYRDQPEAVRIYTLAKRRQPTGAEAPASPETGAAGADWARVEAQAERLEARAAPKAPKTTVDPALQASREAFYRGEVSSAYALAAKSGESWIAGLAAFQLKRYGEARDRFAALAEDETQDEWVRSGAAYWAARSAIAAGEPEAAPQYLTVAARTPYTFYGLIAERQLGLEPAIGPDGLDLGPPTAALAAAARTTAVTGADGAALARLVRTDRRAARAAAFAQIGLKAEAGQEVRTALHGAGAESRRLWTRLGLALNVPLTSPADLNRAGRSRFDIAQYPTPDLAPQGGFTLDRALVYALVRQESRFNPEATSVGGAYGLMQLMPATAARVAGDDKLARNPAPLKDPAINLRLGQDYVTKLLDVMNGDILHAVAAYNAGPGTIMKTVARLGAEADSLMAIESMPGGQTREFVEKVMAGYWIYRNIFGQDSRTLDAAAANAKVVRAAVDLPGPAKRAEAVVLSSFFSAAAN
jgi:soluble lytic murein transglycosylase-like protein